MKPSYFKGIQWTKVFVSGPLDPVHNKHKFYCQICKTNLSIYSKSEREIVRHFRSEGHLRKNQRWRYEHSGKLEKISGNIIHSVRGRDGHVLTPFELEKEKPLFESAPLVYIGPRFPFYDEYMSSAGGLTSSEDIRSGTQISLIGRFVPYFGNLATLQGLWTEVGNFTNHQELFGDIYWSSTKLTVCIVFAYLPFNTDFGGMKKGFVIDRLSLVFFKCRVLFQAIFHHIFLRGMEDVAQTVNDSGLYSLEVEPQGGKEITSLRYWKSGFLVKLQLFQYSLASDPDHNQLLVVARLLSLLSTAPQIVCMCGCTASVLRTVEISSLLKKGIEYSFRYQVTSLHKLMHKREGSVFGRIDFYSQLKYLLAYLAHSLDEPWMSKAPELSKVGFMPWSLGSSPSCTFYHVVLFCRLLTIVTCDSSPTCHIFGDHKELDCFLGSHNSDCTQLRNGWSQK